METTNKPPLTASNPLPSLDATQRIQELWLKARHEITELDANNNMAYKLRWNDFMHGIVHDPLEEPLSFYKLFMEIYDITRSEFDDEPAASNNKKLVAQIQEWRTQVKNCNRNEPVGYHMRLIEDGITLFDRYETAIRNKGLICVIRKNKK